MTRICKKILSSLCLTTLIVSPLSVFAATTAVQPTTNPVTPSSVAKPQANTAMYKAYVEQIQKPLSEYTKFVGATIADLDGDNIDDLVYFTHNEIWGDFSIGFCTYKNGKLILSGGIIDRTLGDHGKVTISLVSDKDKKDFAIKVLSMPENPTNKTVAYYKIKNNVFYNYLDYGSFSNTNGIGQRKEQKVITLNQYNTLANKYTIATTLATTSNSLKPPTDYTNSGKTVFDAASGIVSTEPTSKDPYTLIGQGIIDTIPYHIGDPITKATSVLGQGKVSGFQGVSLHIYDAYTINESSYKPIITGYFFPKGFKFYGITLGDQAQTIEAKLGKNYTKYVYNEESYDELAPADAVYDYTYQNNNNFLTIYFDKNHTSIQADFISKNY